MPSRNLGPRAKPLVALGALALAVILAGFMVYRAQTAANHRADKAHDAAISALLHDNAVLSQQLRAHGITPAVKVPPGATGGTGGTGGQGAPGGPGGNGGTGGLGGPGGKGGHGGNGGAVVVQLTPAPGPSGSPGAQGPQGDPGADGSPGAQGSPGPAPSTVYCDPPDPLHPNDPVACTTVSPTPNSAP